MDARDNRDTFYEAVVAEFGQNLDDESCLDAAAANAKLE